MNTTHQLSASARQSIENVQYALSDQPEMRDTVIHCLRIADEARQQAQNIVNTVGSMLGLLRPARGPVIDQIEFLIIWMQIIQPADALLCEANDAFEAANSAMKCAHVFASKAQELLRSAGDAPR